MQPLRPRPVSALSWIRAVRPAARAASDTSRSAQSALTDMSRSASTPSRQGPPGVHSQHMILPGEPAARSARASSGVAVPTQVAPASTGGPGTGHHPVAVRVRLHDGHERGVRRVGAQRPHVGPQGGQVDLGAGTQRCGLVHRGQVSQSRPTGPARTGPGRPAGRRGTSAWTAAGPGRMGVTCLDQRNRGWVRARGVALRLGPVVRAKAAGSAVAGQRGGLARCALVGRTGGWVRAGGVALRLGPVVRAKAAASTVAGTTRISAPRLDRPDRGSGRGQGAWPRGSAPAVRAKAAASTVAGTTRISAPRLDRPDRRPCRARDMTPRLGSRAYGGSGVDCRWCRGD